MLYSKDGSIPKPETDGTEGWIEVNDPPTADDGFEVVWWFPPGWVVRPIKPADEDGFVWNWNQSEETWVKHGIDGATTQTLFWGNEPAVPVAPIEPAPEPVIPDFNRKTP
jgi:hypothetical protein